MCPIISRIHLLSRVPTSLLMHQGVRAEPRSLAARSCGGGRTLWHGLAALSHLPGTCDKASRSSTSVPRTSFWQRAICLSIIAPFLTRLRKSVCYFRRGGGDNRNLSEHFPLPALKMMPMLKYGVWSIELPPVSLGFPRS